MKNWIIALAFFTAAIVSSQPSQAQVVSQVCVNSQSPFGGTNCNPVTSTNPFPISVYGGTTGQCYTSNGPNTPATFQPCSGGGGAAAISSLTNATGTNSIDNTLFNQTWNWSTLGSQTGLDLAASAATSGTTLLVTMAGTGNTGNAGFFTNTSTSGFALFANGNESVAQNFTVSGNSSLAGTTTVNNLTVTGTCVGCGAVGGTPGTPVGSLQINNTGAFGGLSNTTSSQTALVGLVGQPPLYVANYGAKCNGIYVINATTNGTTVSSASHSFTTADNGALVSIYAGLGTTTTATTTSGSNILTSVSSLTGFSDGLSVIGNNIPNGAKVLDAPSTTSLALNVDATASGTVAITAYPPINTTISSTSGGNATLALSTSTNLTGNVRMYFGADDTTALQAANTAANAAGGGLLELPLGMCMISNSIIIDTNISMNGLGWGKSILKWITTGDMTSPMIESRTQANGEGAVSCNQGKALTQANNRFTWFELDAEAAPQVSGHISAKGFGFSCSANSVIDHTYVHDTPYTGIATDNGFPTYITNNLVVNAGRGDSGVPGGNGIGEGMYNGGGDSYVLNNNVIINTKHYGIFAESQSPGLATNSYVTVNGNYIVGGGISGSDAAIGNSGAAHFTAVGNTIRGNAQLLSSGSSMNGIASDGGTTLDASGVNTVITGNTIDSAFSGVELSLVTTTNGSPENAVVSGNVITNSFRAGIRIDANSSSPMDNVNINGNSIYNSGYAGIWAPTGQGITNLSINGNVINNSGKASGVADNRKAGVALEVSTTGLTMTGNRIYDNGSGNQKYALSVNTSIPVTNAIITGNNFIGNSSNAYNILGTVTGIVKDNLGSPTFTLSGACSSTTPVGTGVNGTFASGTTGSCVTTVLANGTANIKSQNGYNCFANDLTTNADTLTQTGSSTTGCTITGTTVSADSISFGMMPF